MANPLIWCAISGHGFGHAAQVVPVLNELGTLIPGLQAILRTPVPREFFMNRLSIDWTVSTAPQDIGCIQHGPLSIDIPATWAAHEQFHEDWAARVRNEAAAISAAKPGLVLSDIPPLAVAAGAQAGGKTVALGSLTWDEILEPYLDAAPPTRAGQSRVLEQIREAYHRADLMIRLSPGMPMRAFSRVKDVEPLAQRVTSRRANLRATLGALPHERIVVVAFGGIALDSLPVGRMESMTGFRFIVSGHVPAGCRRTIPADTLPFPFGVVLVSGDVLITKPGYSTVVEAVEHRVPVVYVRRYNFADEQGLVDYLHRYGNATELSADDFSAGRWEPALRAVTELPVPELPPPPATGARTAARLLADWL